eukprot:430886_1
MKPYRKRLQSTHLTDQIMQHSESYRTLDHSFTFKDDNESCGGVIDAFAPPLRLVIDYKIGVMKTQCILDHEDTKCTPRKRRKSIDLNDDDDTFEVYGATVKSLRRKNKKNKKKKMKKKKVKKKNNESVLNRLKRAYGNDFEIYC